MKWNGGKKKGMGKPRFFHWLRTRKRTGKYWVSTQNEHMRLTDSIYSSDAILTLSDIRSLISLTKLLSALYELRINVAQHKIYFVNLRTFAIYSLDFDANWMQFNFRIQDIRDISSINKFWILRQTRFVAQSTTESWHSAINDHNLILLCFG